MRPILSKRNKKHVKYKKKIYVLYPYLDLCVIKSEASKGRYSFNLGRLLGEMHTYSELNKSKYRNLRISKYFWDRERASVIFNKVSNILQRTKNKKLFDQVAFSMIEKKIAYIKRKAKRYSLDTDNYILLHGDFNNENVFYDQSGDIVSIFDFEKSTVGSLSYEIINALVISFFSSYKNKNFNRAKWFLDGYQSVRNIDKTQLKASLEFFTAGLFYTTLFEEEKYLKNNDRLDPIYAHYNNSLNYFSKKNNFSERILRMIK